MKTTETPPSASSATASWISAFAPTSMPRVGSSRMSSSGRLGGEPATQQHLLLVAAGQVHDEALGVGRAHAQLLDVLGDELVLLLAADGPGPAAPGLEAEDEVLAHRELADDALVAAVLGRVGDALREPCRRGAQVDLLALLLEGAGVGAVGAVDQARELGAARAEEAGDADDPPG